MNYEHVINVNTPQAYFEPKFWNHLNVLEPD